MYLVDTNLLSEMRLYPFGRAASSVTAWLKERSPDELFLSAVTVFESEIGIRRMERRDPAQGAVLRGWMTTSVLPLFAGRILPVDDRVAALAASFHIPNPAPVAGSLIAATALLNGLTVATRNTGDFRFPGVVVLNPWTV